MALSERSAREAAEVKRLMAEADEQRQRQEWERAAEIRAQQAHASSGIPAPLYQGRAHTPRRQRGSLTPTAPGSPLPLSPARSPATRQPLAAALMAAAHTESPRPKTKRPVRKKQAQPQPEPEPEPRKEQRTPAPKTPKSPSRYSFLQSAELVPVPEHLNSDMPALFCVLRSKLPKRLGSPAKAPTRQNLPLRFSKPSKLEEQELSVGDGPDAEAEAVTDAEAESEAAAEAEEAARAAAEQKARANSAARAKLERRQKALVAKTEELEPREKRHEASKSASARERSALDRERATLRRKNANLLKLER